MQHAPHSSTQIDTIKEEVNEALVQIKKHSEAQVKEGILSVESRIQESRIQEDDQTTFAFNRLSYSKSNEPAVTASSMSQHKNSVAE